MKKGFTLLELLIVVIVISVLASFAVPQYLTAVERAKGAKAQNALGLISQAEKMYRAENDVYINFAAGAADGTLGDYIELTEVDNDQDWTYTVTGSSATAFTATATRAAGANSGDTITLVQDGVWGGTFPYIP
jgi:type IV pilus assembly protein PilE